MKFLTFTIVFLAILAAREVFALSCYSCPQGGESCPIVECNFKEIKLCDEAGHTVPGGGYAEEGSAGEHVEKPLDQTTANQTAGQTTGEQAKNQTQTIFAGDHFGHLEKDLVFVIGTDKAKEYANCYDLPKALSPGACVSETLKIPGGKTILKRSCWNPKACLESKLHKGDKITNCHFCFHDKCNDAGSRAVKNSFNSLAIIITIILWALVLRNF